MQTMAEIFQGAIALEYHETVTKLLAAEKYSDKNKPKKELTTCGGEGCTTNAPNLPCKDEVKNQTCNVQKKKKSAETFQPVVPGWSEPPAARV